MHWGSGGAFLLAAGHGSFLLEHGALDAASAEHAVGREGIGEGAASCGGDGGGTGK